MAQKSVRTKRVATETAPQTEEKPQTPATSETTTVDDIDAILDEIDEVLEENALDFVNGYIQKGGE